MGYSLFSDYNLVFGNRYGLSGSQIFIMPPKVIANFTNLVATGISLWITSALFDGFSFDTTEALLITTVLLTLINIFVKPIIYY